MRVEINPEFLNKVLVIAEENLNRIHEMMNREQKLRDRARKILYKALLSWARRAPPEELIEVLEISPDTEDTEDLRWKAEWEIDSLWASPNTMLEIAEKISEKHAKMKEALDKARDLLKRADKLKKKRLAIMPIGKHIMLTWDNLIALATLVYKICRELEKEGIEP